MEHPPSNEPVMESKPGVAGWFQVWKTAVTKPNEQTFIDLTESPDASSKTAYLWAFIVGTVSGIAQAILQAIYTATGTTPTIPGLEQFMPSGGDPRAAGVSLLVMLCLSPVFGAIYTLFFALGVAIVQWIAKLFGGKGSYEKLLYAIAAISVPFTLVSAVLILLGSIPFIGFCFGILSFGLSIYVFVLQIMAVKGVNRFGWGPAIGSVIIPGLVIFTICCCLVFATASLLAPVFSEVVEGMQLIP
jgi:hypothetical protein